MRIMITMANIQSRTKCVGTRFNFVHFSKYHQSYTSYYLQTIPKRFFSHPPLPGSMLVLQSRGQLTNFDRNWALTNIEWGGGGMCQQFCPGLSELYSRNNSHSAGTIERKHISVTFPWANESHTLKVPREKQVFDAQELESQTFSKGLVPRLSEGEGRLWSLCA